MEKALNSKLNKNEVEEILAGGCGKAFKAFGEFLEVRFTKVETDLETIGGKLNLKLEPRHLQDDG